MIVTKRLPVNTIPKERAMAMSSSETMKDMMDKASFERIEQDFNTIRRDIATLADQIRETVGHLAGAARRQARHGYGQAQANMDAAISGISERGSDLMEAAGSIEETLEEAITQRPLATVGLALGLGFLIGAAWRR